MARQSTRWVRDALFSVGAVLLFVPVASLATLIIVGLLNADLYERQIETKSLGEALDGEPEVLVIIHKLVPEENEAELSVMLSLQPSSAVVDSVRQGTLRFRATVYDATALRPFAPSAVAIVDSSVYLPGSGVLTATSPRFTVPVYSSVNGYPLDENQLELSIFVEGLPGLGRTHSLKIQKALPGRLLSISGQPYRPTIILKRSPLEKGLVFTSSAVFLVLSLIVATQLFRSRDLNVLQESLAVAGFLLATVGFRDLVGISRAEGTSALEIIVFGVPIVLLTIAMLKSVISSWRKSTRDLPPP